MRKIKQATRIINTNDICTKNNFVYIKDINHSYTVYDATETTIILRQTSVVRQLINEAILTHLNNGKIKVDFNRYTF